MHFQALLPSSKAHRSPPSSQNYIQAAPQPLGHTSPTTARAGSCKPHAKVQPEGHSSCTQHITPGLPLSTHTYTLPHLAAAAAVSCTGWLCLLRLCHKQLLPSACQLHGWPHPMDPFRILLQKQGTCWPQHEEKAAQGCAQPPRAYTHMQAHARSYHTVHLLPSIHAT
jgi:hypothetical protein